MKLVIDNYEHNKKLDLPHFLYLFLCSLNHLNDTLDLSIEGDDKIQCDAGRHRSLSDIHEICKSYYPNIKRETVKEVLLNFGPKLVGWYCSGIHKRIYEHSDCRLYMEQCYNSYSYREGDEKDPKKDEYCDYISYKVKNHYNFARKGVHSVLGRDIQWVALAG